MQYTDAVLSVTPAGAYFPLACGSPIYIYYAEWALFHNVADLSIAYKIFGPRVGFFPMVNIKD